MAEDSCSHLNAITKVKHPTRRECEEFGKLNEDVFILRSEAGSDHGLISEYLCAKRAAKRKLGQARL